MSLLWILETFKIHRETQTGELELQTCAELNGNESYLEEIFTEEPSYIGPEFVTPEISITADRASIASKSDWGTIASTAESLSPNVEGITGPDCENLIETIRDKSLSSVWAVKWLELVIDEDIIFGSGAMSKVYVGLNRDNELLAIKQNKRTLLSTGEPLGKSALKQEKDVLMQLGRHKNIVHYLGEISVDPSFRIVLECLDAGSLAHRLGTDTGINAPHVATETIDALVHIHEKGIVHCDVKPANIMFSSQKRVVLIDFGSAEFVKDAVKKEKFRGTLTYLPPWYRSKKDLIRTDIDIWAWALTMRLVLQKKSPFNEKLDRKELETIVGNMVQTSGEQWKQLPSAQNLQVNLRKAYPTTHCRALTPVEL